MAYSVLYNSILLFLLHVYTPVKCYHSEMQSEGKVAGAVFNVQTNVSYELYS